MYAPIASRIGALDRCDLLLHGTRWRTHLWPSRRRTRPGEGLQRSPSRRSEPRPIAVDRVSKRVYGAALADVTLVSVTAMTAACLLG